MASILLMLSISTVAVSQEKVILVLDASGSMWGQIDGKAKIKISPGTQGGKVLRLKGKGLPDVNGYGKGDILVNVNIWTPRNLSSEEKSILEKLKSSPNFKPNPTSKDKSYFDRMRDFFS